MATELAPLDQDHFDVLRLAGTLDEKRKHICLRVLAETANIKLAAQAAGYKTTAAINRMRRDDPAFEAAFQEAAESAGDMIEAEAVRRAVDGVKEAVWYKGEVVGYEIKYSDSLLATILKAAKQDKYSDRQKIETNVNVKVGVAVIPMAGRSLKDWEAHSIHVHEEQKKLNAPGAEPVIDADFTEVPRSVERG